MVFYFLLGSFLPKCEQYLETYTFSAVQQQISTLKGQGSGTNSSAVCNSVCLTLLPLVCIKGMFELYVQVSMHFHFST